MICLCKNGEFGVWENRVREVWNYAPGILKYAWGWGVCYSLCGAGMLIRLISSSTIPARAATTGRHEPTQISAMLITSTSILVLVRPTVAFAITAAPFAA